VVAFDGWPDQTREDGAVAAVALAAPARSADAPAGDAARATVIVLPTPAPAPASAGTTVTAAPGTVNQVVQDTGTTAAPVVDSVVAPVQGTVNGLGAAIPAVKPVTDVVDQTLNTVTGLVNGLAGPRTTP
jgi:phage-related minor tail protein